MKYKKAEQAISRVLYPLKAGDGHLSGVTVTRNLKRPTRELGRAILKRSPIWSCSGWGLPSSCCHQRDW